MLRTFLHKLRWPLAGAAGAALVLTTATALAGSGIGGIFNLGQGNSVNAQTALSGTTNAGAQLRVDNASTSAGTIGVLGRMSSSSATADSAGVRGVNLSSGSGVYGTSSSGKGVWGHTTSGQGVYGDAAAGPSGIGVKGFSPDHIGVFAQSNTGVALAAVAGTGNGVAADFSGKVDVHGRIVSIAIVDISGTSTPNVNDANLFEVNNTSPRTITSLTGGVTGQVIVLAFLDANTTVQDGGNLQLAGNFISSPNDTLELVHAGVNWFEISRSNN
jgi:hypothetical protein